MNPRGNTLKLTAVSALVVLTLTGFSTGRGHGGSGDGGGGCSSSGQNHDSSTSGGGSHRDYDDDDDHDTSGSGGDGEDASTSPQDATVELVTCASEADPYATVEVTNPNTTDGVFTVTVIFEDAAGAEVVARSQDVAVPAGGTATAQVDVGDTADVPRVAECDPGLYAPAAY